MREEKRRQQEQTKAELDFSLKLKMKRKVSPVTDGWDIKQIALLSLLLLLLLPHPFLPILILLFPLPLLLLLPLPLLLLCQAKQAQEEVAMDMKLLEQMLQQSTNQAQEQQQRKKELRDEMKRYQEYLAEQQREEEKKARELDAMVTTEVEKQWAKRLEQWKQEKAARKKLMEEVMEGRKKQIQDKCELCCTTGANHTTIHPTVSITIVHKSIMWGKCMNIFLISR